MIGSTNRRRTTAFPFFKGKVSGLFKTGVRATIRRRDFEARRFVFQPQRITTLDLYLPSNQLFAPDNIRPDGFQIIEYTRGTDTYGAEMNIYAGYAMVDLALGASWRIVGGVRFEDSDQMVTTIDNLRAERQAGSGAACTTTIRFRPSMSIYALTAAPEFPCFLQPHAVAPGLPRVVAIRLHRCAGRLRHRRQPEPRCAPRSTTTTPAGSGSRAAISWWRPASSPNSSPIRSSRRFCPSNDLRQSFVQRRRRPEHRRGTGVPALAGVPLAQAARVRRLQQLHVRRFEHRSAGRGRHDRDFAVAAACWGSPVTSPMRILRVAAPEMAQRREVLRKLRFAPHLRDVGLSRSRRTSIRRATPSSISSYQYTLREQKGKWSIRFEAENLGNNDYPLDAGRRPAARVSSGPDVSDRPELFIFLTSSNMRGEKQCAFDCS